MKLEHKLSRLFFQHIRGTELQERGVTAEDLAKNLEANGFIQILPTGKYVELPKKFDASKKSDYFKTIWGTVPSSRWMRL